jgi:hypothetical protein
MWASFQQYLDDSWTSEISATVLSALCLVAIAVVLRASECVHLTKLNFFKAAYSCGTVVGQFPTFQKS